MTTSISGRAQGANLALDSGVCPKEAALAYHENPSPGKLEISIKKPTATQKDLALAYTPGVAEPVRAIAENPENAYRYTSKGNLVAVITNGTAILGLGNLGALASKPVMEGKAVLFKKFADVDVFDIEVATEDPKAFIETVRLIAPTFGGINLEDIKAPECFEIEAELQKLLDIPVFHDDQHGTAVVILAGLLNALEVQEKQLKEAQFVCVGAGSAGIATMRLLKAIGVPPEHIMLLDREGVVHAERQNLNAFKQEFAIKTSARTVQDALKGADVLIGVSGPRVIDPLFLKSMNRNPIVFALANPEPEIRPELAKAIRSDVLMATGRGDYPNQVNNVLCFPYIFRGALDVRARHINQAMMIAAAEAIRQLAHEPTPDVVYAAYPKTPKGTMTFGRDYILPQPLDPRLRERVPERVAATAVETGVTQLK